MCGVSGGVRSLLASDRDVIELRTVPPRTQSKHPRRVITILRGCEDLVIEDGGYLEPLEHQAKVMPW